MSRFPKALAGAILLGAAALAAAGEPYPGIGRAATQKEVAAWDIDVRPDFKGLPPGSGSTAKGQDVWESKCSHCHGIFGESNEVFNPLVGGTTAADIQSGRVANLSRTDYPGRTTFMKVATLSTLWDYINRAMPWTNPKSLSTEEVYAVTAYLLSLAGVVPDEFTLSDRNIAEVQKRMPNRNGMSTQHALWPGSEFGGIRTPDTANTACMKDCIPEPKVASFLPAFARNAHGNLKDQNRLVGAQHGADTSQAEPKTGVKPLTVSAAPASATAPAPTPAAAATPTPAAAREATADPKAAQALLGKHNCTVCHAVDRKVLGPSFQDVARKHAGKADYLAGKIKSGGAGVWGPMPMPPQTLSAADAQQIAQWIASGAAR